MENNISYGVCDWGMRWGGGGGDRRQTLRQVCHTTATGKPERFYGNSFCCLSPHGRSPFAGARRDLEPKQERGEPAGVQCGNTEGLEAPPSVRAHRKPPDCQAADSTAAILWRKKKKKSPWRFNGLQGFQIKPAPSAFTLASQMFMHHEEDYTCPFLQL